MFGATQKNDPIRLEQFAINIKDSIMGDNSRIPINNIPIILGAAAGYCSTIPLKEILEGIKDEGVDSIISNHAGTHTCNELSFRVYDWLAKKPFPHYVGAVFIHVSFPNSFGVIEDHHWATATFEQLVKSSMCIIKAISAWYIKKNGPVE